MRDTDVKDIDVRDMNVRNTGLSDKDRTPAPDVPPSARDSHDVSLDALPGFLLEKIAAGGRCGSSS